MRRYTVFEAVLLRWKIIRRNVSTATAFMWLVGEGKTPFDLFCLRSIMQILTNPNWVNKHALIPASRTQVIFCVGLDR